ncbi:NHLP bacteriocin system secretion protein [Nostoc punctiforme]|uniref:Secretion protein HlyD n=1 Tax=Nostoc punctiforme (strain ATCC 29133 / PCC 73102) TaxID=63737 RepID=B2JAK7_NOSP7|nr:NHLP bacteriocin system secretion protein [Nostoc punctiforme]ACC84961.1 secretion protein HlyD [Nostoc punctiforme PCC 73102]
MLLKKQPLLPNKSLERLASPERLDQLMQIVSPKSWLTLISLSSLVILSIVWSVYGRIPITIEGKGVLIYPRKVIPLESKSSGQLLNLNIKVGDIIQKGQLLATIDQTLLHTQLQQQKSKLTEMTAQNQAASLLQGQGNTQDYKTIQQQRQNAQQRIQELQALSPILRTKSFESIQKQRLQLQQRVTKLEALTPILKRKNHESLQQQRQSFQQRIQAAKAQLPFIEKKVKSFKQLVQQKVVSETELYQTQEEYFKKVEEIAQLETQVKDLEVREGDAQERYINNQNEIASNLADLQKLELEETNADEAYLKNQNEIAQLRAELKDLDSREANHAKQNLQDSSSRNREIQEVKREIASLEEQLNSNSQIISQHSGRILEITVTPGQVINVGTRLANVGAENPSNKLLSVTYFPIADGKKIQSGMPIQITPQTVKRERFGGIVGNINDVSPFPITKEAAASLVGNPELVEGLVSQKQEGFLQVFAELEQDSTTPSGYKWSSSNGPQMKISPGTTTVVRVKVEERAPITFVLPILRSVSGIF